MLLQQFFKPNKTALLVVSSHLKIGASDKRQGARAGAEKVEAAASCRRKKQAGMPAPHFHRL